MPTPAGCWSSAAPGSTVGIGVARRGLREDRSGARDELFIREGLVNDTITWPFDFLAHNRKVRDKVEIVLTRTRSQRLPESRRGRLSFLCGKVVASGSGGAPVAGEAS